jgi:hypothetical protein
LKSDKGGPEWEGTVYVEAQPGFSQPGLGKTSGLGGPLGTAHAPGAVGRIGVARPGMDASARKPFASVWKGFSSFLPLKSSFSLPWTHRKSLISLGSNMTRESRFKENQGLDRGFISARVVFAAPRLRRDLAPRILGAKQSRVNILFDSRTF